MCAHFVKDVGSFARGGFSMSMTEENATSDQQISYDEFTLNFKLQEDIPVEQFELSMYNYEFVGNRTVCNLKVVDGVRVLQYKIPATLPLEQFLRKQLYKGEFLSILSNILNQLMYFEENKMPLNKILLNVKCPMK